MKPFQINLINAVALIIVGMWGYFASGSVSITALIPVFAGIVLLLLGLGLKTGNKIMAHVVVVLTLLTLGALFKPLSGAFARQDNAAIFRVMLMMIAGLAAMVVYIRSFIEARKNRKSD